MTNKDALLSIHLQELRRVLIRCLTALAVCLVPMFFVAPFLLRGLLKIILGTNDVVLNYFAPLEVFVLQLKTALTADLIVCFPYTVRQIWRFVAPGLYQNERRFITSLVWISGVLFVVGVAFCLTVILPTVVRFGLSFADRQLHAVFGLSEIVTLALGLSFVFGLMFQFPLITYALIATDMASYRAVKSKRPYIFVGILILSAFLTPPDVVSQLLLTVPTYFLFELGLFFARRKKYNDSKRL